MRRNDTIAAIATAPGRGGIAVVRIAGPDAFSIADKIWHGKKLSDCKSHTAHLGNIVDLATGEILDQAVATVFKAPGSYTGDDTVELSIHGSPYVQSQLLKILIDSGCRLAEPGEYTRRAFISGHLDLAEAEAVADLISASSRSSHRIALNQMRGKLSETLADLRTRLLKLSSLIELELDFSEEDVTFASRAELREVTSGIIEILQRLTDSFSTAKAIREGVPMAIVGAPNAGKSTLLNTLANDERAIVSPIAGTTRDTVEDIVEIAGTTFRLIDTAGLRSDPADEIEAIGINRTVKAIKKASIVIWVVDPSEPEAIYESSKAILESLQPDSTLILAINKADILPPPHKKLNEILAKVGAGEKALEIFNISATTPEGIIPLTDYLKNTIDPSLLESALLTNSRHYQAASAALESMKSVGRGLGLKDSEKRQNSAPENEYSAESLTLDLVALDLRAAIHHLGEITGAITTPEVLASIFSSFCIGK